MIKLQPPFNENNYELIKSKILNIEYNKLNQNDVDYEELLEIINKTITTTENRITIKDLTRIIGPFLLDLHEKCNLNYKK